MRFGVELISYSYNWL